MPSNPFSARERETLIEALPDGYGYAFNFADPVGVKLISPVLYAEVKAGKSLAEIAAQNPQLRAAVDKIENNPRPKLPAQLNVWLHVINGCNFSCHYCYIPHLNKNVSRSEIEKSSLQDASIHPLLNNLIGYCEDQKISALHITFAGGEPTLNLPLVESFCREALASNHGLKVTFGMISNGSFNYDELAPLLLRYKISISLSMDGFEESHDKIRFEMIAGRKIGSWQTILKNVQLLLAAGISPYFLYTITPKNVADLPSFATFVHGHRLGFRLSLVRERKTPDPDLQFTIANSLKQLYRHLGETLDHRLPIFRHAAFAEWDLHLKKHVPCTSCRNYFAIDTKGGVATCQMRMDRLYGNAQSEPFSSIVSRIQNDSQNHTLAFPALRQGACSKCEYFHVCAGGCPQHTQQAIGMMDHPSPWCHVFGTVLPEYIRANARQLQRAVLARKN